MAEFRTIHSKMWRDSWFTELDCEGKLLWIYLITNHAASLTGIYYMTVKFAAFETGLGQERVQTLLAQFVLSGKIEYENDVVWIRRMRKYQASNESSPKIKPRIEKDLSEIPDCKVKRLYIAQYPIDDVSIPIHTDTDTDTDTDKDTDTDTDKDLGANAPIVSESTGDKPKRKTSKPKRQSAEPKLPREHDALFDAIVKVCCVDPSTAGASVGKVRATLSATEPPYTPDEVNAFGDWWNSDEWRRKKGPPTLWKLREQIGFMRNGHGKDSNATYQGNSPAYTADDYAAAERINAHRAEQRAAGKLSL